MKIALKEVWSFVLQKQNEFIAKKLSDTLELVIRGHKNP